jgi:hypothetical protein
MEAQKNNRSKWLHLRLTADEHRTIKGYFTRSNCRKLSEYARLQLLRKPIISKVRNESMDLLMGEIIALRNEVNAIGNNFNQAVKKLHTLQQASEIKDWILRYELDKKVMANKMEEVKKCIQKIGELWLR